MKRHFTFLIPALMLVVLVTAAYAGGWAVISVGRFPDYAVAGEALRLTFSVRQHGVTLLAGLKPTVRASTTTGLNASAAVTPTANQGQYTASLVLSQPGEWNITIDSTFGASSSVKLPMLKVIPAGSPAPRPFAGGTRGGRLFVAKGCVGCHRHQEINPARTTSPEFDLTRKRFSHEELKKFLADPSIKTADMPNPNLKQEEIAALAAFINKTSEKKAR
jgi:mono/diheme cytochrome c family protein